ncbi:MAG: CxxC-x17-CxxC domain-containing protein [Candidatus Falkowbacteria bacterium]
MSDITFFAQTTFRNQMRKFGIKTDDRRRHMYLIGKTGMGKSTILENMIIDDILAGHGVGVVDPHGDLAEKIIQFIPEERIKDVIYFNPSDIEFPIAFNVVEQVEPHLRHLVASGLIGVFQKLWADSWGPRLEYILRNAILAIMDSPGSTLMGVVRILSDKSFRKKVVSNIKDPVVKAFWEKEFASYADKFASEAVSPIQNKVGQFLSTAFMRNIIGQTESSLDMRKIMDENKILIMNLSKGRIGEDNSALLGAMMITKIQMAAMSRVDIDEKERKDFYLYIDEFQNFSTDSFANILSEARKYRLCLVMAHQYIEQLTDMVKAAVFGNVGTMIVFRVGAADAEDLVREFTPTFTEEDIVNLPKYEMYLKLMIDGISSDPFSARGLPPLSSEYKTGNEAKVIAYTREHYAASKEEVEEKILRWHDEQEDAPRLKDVVPSDSRYAEEIAEETKRDKQQARPAQNFTKPEASRPYVSDRAKEDAPGFDVICHNCGKNTKTPFQPDGVRPVYCKECLDKLRKQKEESLKNRQVAKEKELANLKPSVAPTPAATPAPSRPAAPLVAPLAKPVTAPARPVNNYVPAQPKPRMQEVKADTVEPSQILSLNDLASFKPVDFKGREMAIPKAKIEEEDEGEEVIELDNNAPDDKNNGQALKEGETVKF